MEKVNPHLVCGCYGSDFASVERYCAKALHDVYKVLDYACNSCLFKHF